MPEPIITRIINYFLKTFPDDAPIYFTKRELIEYLQEFIETYEKEKHIKKEKIKKL